MGAWERTWPGQCVSTTLPTLLQYSTYLYLSTYMYVYVSFRESGTKSKTASLPQGPCNPYDDMSIKYDVVCRGLPCGG